MIIICVQRYNDFDIKYYTDRCIGIGTLQTKNNTNNKILLLVHVPLLICNRIFNYTHSKETIYIKKKCLRLHTETKLFTSCV